MRLSGKHILLGVTGGIAAYKSAVLLRYLQKEGAEVRVCMTPSATRFLGTDTLAALSRNDVALDWFPDADQIQQTWSRHIQWANWADLYVIAPCTANTLSDIAHGKASTPLTALLLACECPVVIAPAMDGGMYRNRAVQSNVERCRSYGYHMLDPSLGYLASGLTDVGRMQEPEVITTYIAGLLNAPGFKTPDALPLAGKKVVVTAGPTREYIDAVRFISNPSSGKMGFAMAEAARDFGAEVVLVSGPVELPLPEQITSLKVTSATEMYETVMQHTDANVFILAAAVSDFKASAAVPHKIAKSEAALEVRLEPTPDILLALGERKEKGQFLIGFAMETDQLLEKAQAKRLRKKADVILANTITSVNGNAEGGFGSDTNTLWLLSERETLRFEGSKKEIARQILQHLIDHDDLS
jgi:phosphopantothenoylcysteine decarboxylase/phosphopantothenate--cysteine ligase